MKLFTRMFESLPVVVKEAPLDKTATPPPLFPVEEKLLQKAVQKRRVEFSLGRTLARAALGDLGMPANLAIPVNDDRSPQWPDKVIGAITHCNSWCAAAVAFKADVEWLGLDVEEYLLRKLDDGMLGYICVDAEREWLAQFSGDAYRRAAMAIFSAKEAWYKGCYPITQRFLDFKGAQIVFESFSTTAATWRGILCKDWGPYHKGQQFPFGRSVFDDRYVGSVFVKANSAL